MAVTGAKGLAEAQRRFGDRRRSASQTLEHDEWTMEALLEPGRRGAAHAAARQGNASARRALADLKAATDALAQGGAS
jgi:hypothetical protein